MCHRRKNAPVHHEPGLKCKLRHFMWFSSACTNMGQQTRTTWYLLRLFRHGTSPLPWITSTIIPWERAFVDRKTDVFLKSVVLPALINVVLPAYWGNLLRQVGVDIYRQLIVLVTIHSSLFHDQLPEPVFLSRTQNRVALQNMLGGKKICLCSQQKRIRRCSLAYGSENSTAAQSGRRCLFAANPFSCGNCRERIT